MQQAWHIFKKDVRHLRWLIAFLLTLTVLFTWVEMAGGGAQSVSDDLEPILLMAAGYTIARLIHAEALPGENQFWITRPYRWTSLLAAKLMFMAAFVNLPVLAAQAVVLIWDGFPIASILPGLLWTQVLITVCVVLPCAVMGALTANMLEFVASPLGIAFVAFGVLYFGAFYLMRTPDRIEWIRNSILVGTLAVLAPPVLYLQYRFRRTQFSRMVAVGVAVCGVALYVALPWRSFYPIQEGLSKQKLDVEIRRDPQGRFVFNQWPGGLLQFRLPLEFNGLPEGAEMEIETFSVNLVAPDGRETRLAGDFNTHLNIDGKNVTGKVYVNPEFLALERGQPLALRTTFYFTVFGNAREQTIAIRHTPVNVMDGLQCYEVGFVNQVMCRAPFRWPGAIVTQRGAGGGGSALTHLISYSPFAANLQLDPTVHKAADFYSREPLPDGRAVTIAVSEPVAYLRREVEVRDLRLQ